MRIHVILTNKKTFEVIDIRNALQINLKSGTLDKWVVHTGASQSTEYDINTYNCAIVGLVEVV